MTSYVSQNLKNLGVMVTMVEKVQMPFGGRRKNAKKEGRRHVFSSMVVKVVLKSTKSE